MRDRNFSVTMCEQEKMLALSLGTSSVNTPIILDMEKMVCCLLEIKEQNKNHLSVAGEQRFFACGCCQRRTDPMLQGQTQEIFPLANYVC
jgi:hypothetical protein